MSVYAIFQKNKVLMLQGNKLSILAVLTVDLATEVIIYLTTKHLSTKL